MSDNSPPRDTSDPANGPLPISAFVEKAAVLLDAYTTGTPEAMARLYQHTWHRRTWETMRTYVQLDLGKRPTGPADRVEISVDDARYLIAREHGFESWGALEAFTRSAPARAVPRPMRVVSGAATGTRKTDLRSRDLDALIEALERHPSPGVAAEGQMTDATLGEIARVGTITALDLSGSKLVTDLGVRHLARLPALERLDLSGTAVTDAGMQVLGALPALRHLALAWTRVTDNGLAGLVGCDRLEHLDLAGTAAGGGALRAVAGKTALRHLQLALDDADIPLLRELPLLRGWRAPSTQPECMVFGVSDPPTHLWLRGTFTDRGLRELEGLDGLYSLDIDDARLAITAAGLEPLAALPHLCALRVDATDDWMPAISRMPRLRYLGVQDTSAGDDGFVALSRSRTIEYLWGRRCHNLRRRGFEALATMPSLRGLSVSCLNVDDDALSLLPSFPALVELMPMDVPDDGFRHVGACRRLESLILMYCRETTDAATEHLTDLPALSYYFNSYTTITDRTPALLSGIGSLERVTFDTCHGLTNAGVAMLARLPRLRALRATGRGITADVGRAFGEGVEVSVEP